MQRETKSGSLHRQMLTRSKNLSENLIGAPEKDEGYRSYRFYSMDSREIHRSLSDPLIALSATAVRHVRSMTLSWLWASLRTTRSIILGSFLLFSLILSLFVAVYTYSKVPTHRALPDIVADVWPTFGLLRSASLMSTLVLSSWVTVVLVILCVIYTYRCFTVCKIRKYVFLFSVGLCFRAICNISTQLPPPCTGFPNCKCVVSSFDKVIEGQGVFRILMTYIATLGIGTKGTPTCGGLLMSGDLLVQSILGRYLLETIQMVMPKEKFWAVQFTVHALIAISFVYVVLIRSEYSIGVSTSVIWVWLVLKLYRAAEVMNELSFGPFVTSPAGRFFSWLDNDVIEVSEPDEVSSDSF